MSANAATSSILEQLVGETGEPERVIESAQALAERSLGELRELVNARLTSPLAIEVGDIEIVRFGQAAPGGDGVAALAIASVPHAPDAVALRPAPDFVAMIVDAMFGGDPEQQSASDERPPSAIELQALAQMFAQTAQALDGSGGRS